jgi:hypothetical protein
MMEGLGQGDHVVPGPERTLSHMGSSVDCYVKEHMDNQYTGVGLMVSNVKARWARQIELNQDLWTGS